MQYATGREWLLAYLKKYRRRLAIGTVFVFISVGLGVFVPRQVGVAIDDLTSGVTSGKLLRSVMLIIGVQIVSGVFLYFQRRTLINMSRYIEFDLRQDFYAHLQKMPLAFFQNNRTGGSDGAGDERSGRRQADRRTCHHV